MNGIPADYDFGPLLKDLLRAMFADGLLTEDGRVADREKLERIQAIIGSYLPDVEVERIKRVVDEHLAARASNTEQEHDS